MSLDSGVPYKIKRPRLPLEVDGDVGVFDLVSFFDEGIDDVVPGYPFCNWEAMFLPL